jgi:hypothetical protein
MSLKTVYLNWSALFRNAAYRWSLVLSFVFVAVGLMFHSHVISYIEHFARVTSVQDFLLERLPLLDLSIMYFSGSFVTFVILFLFLILYRPDFIPFVIKCVASVFTVRAFFILLTHLGPPEGFFMDTLRPNYDYWPFQSMLYSNDLFFSGHVAYPFLLFLIFYRQKKGLSYFFFIVSILMAFTVLMMRIHYSIDVFAAYFITFGIYRMVSYFFAQKDSSFQSLLHR